MNVITQRILSNKEQKLSWKVYYQKIRKLVYKYTQFDTKKDVNEIYKKEKTMNALRAKQIQALIDREEKMRLRIYSANGYGDHSHLKSKVGGNTVEVQGGEMWDRLIAHRNLLRENINIKNYKCNDHAEEYNYQISQLREKLEPKLQKDLDILHQYGINKHLLQIKIDLKLGSAENRELKANKFMSRFARLINITGAKAQVDVGLSGEIPNAKLGAEVGFELDSDNLRKERNILGKEANQAFKERLDMRGVYQKGKRSLLTRDYSKENDSDNATPLSTPQVFRQGASLANEGATQNLGGRRHSFKQNPKTSNTVMNSSFINNSQNIESPKFGSNQQVSNSDNTDYFVTCEIIREDPVGSRGGNESNEGTNYGVFRPPQESKLQAAPVEQKSSQGQKQTSSFFKHARRSVSFGR